MAVGMIFFALQEQARKSGYMILKTDKPYGEKGCYVVADLLKECVVSIEPNLNEVADLLGAICLYSKDERLARMNAEKANIEF